MKPQIYLECHQYAPELNKLWVGGRAFAVPSVTTLGEARRAAFPKASRDLVVSVATKYAAPKHKWLERVRTGKVPSLLDAVRFARNLRASNAGGETLAGYLPPVQTAIKILQGF